MYSSILYTAFIAFGLSLILSPIAGKLARAGGIVDVPDQDRKFHGRRVPLVGGLVVLGSLLCVIAVSSLSNVVLLADVGPLIAGMIVIVTVGLIDDRFALRSRQKLIGQCLAVACVIGGGFEFAGLRLLWFPLDLGVLAIPVFAILLLGSINAFNLLDGADGFASSIGLVTSVAICGVAAHSGHVLEATLAAGLAASLLGFLIFNLPPARMFLGDSGSMLIGLVVGSLVFRAGAPSGEPVPVGVALALLALPFMDMCAAIIRRLLTGRSVALGDRAHLHHCLMRRGFGPRRLVVAAAALCAIPMAGVGAHLFAEQYNASWLGILALGSILVGTRSFGGTELRLIVNRVLGYTKPYFEKREVVNVACERQVRIGLSESKDCQELWSAFTSFATAHDLSTVKMHFNGTWMDDGADVVWERCKPKQSVDNWTSKMPIYAGDRLFGNVEMTGSVVGNSGEHILAPLGELLQSVTPSVERLFGDVARRSVAQQLGEQNRVLFVNRSYWPDVEATGQLLTDLCEDLASDFDVSVLAGQPNHVTHRESFQSSGTQMRNNVEIFRVRHSTFSKNSMFGKALNLVSFTVAALWQVFWIPKHEVVVVETDPFLLAIVGGLLKKCRGGKLIVYMQDVYPDVATAIGKVKHGWLTGFTKFFMHKALNYADRVVVLGEDMKRRLVGHGIDEAKIDLIPNWIDSNIVYPVKENNAFRDKYNLRDKFVIMHSGNMGLTQELDDIIEVASQMQDRKEIVFVFVGNGASQPRLEALVNQEQLHNVLFLDYQPRAELAISLSAADLHLVSMHPNITGCLVPSKLYGIMASATPVLAVVPRDTDVWSLVTTEGIGVAVGPGEISAIRAAIECCVEGEVDLAEMGKRARTLVESRYDRKHGCASFGALLDNYVARREPNSFIPTRRDDDERGVPSPHAIPERHPALNAEPIIVNQGYLDLPSYNDS